jgi:8-oxo-dGTP pyrophosphatase MutT (NUDIX family)
MKLTSLKAGIVPFLKDGRALFMVSSNAAFGGTDPAIAKGRIDDAEGPMNAAVREGSEELGANMASAPFLGWAGKVTGLQASYPIEVYAVLVKDAVDFDKTDTETARTVWMSRADFKNKGRESHRLIVDKIFDQIEVALKNK